VPVRLGVEISHRDQHDLGTDGMGRCGESGPRPNEVDQRLEAGVVSTHVWAMNHAARQSFAR
jgi:hypothetical protein